MNWFNSDWLASWAGLDGADAMPLVSTLVAVVALMVLWRVLRRGGAGGRAARDYDVSGDQFAQSAPISEEQVQLLHYLQQAFPDGAVLFQPRLARFLMVRKSRHRLGAQQRLGDTHVDFLVCADDGKPLFAFEVDAFKAKGDAGLARSAAEKNGMLKGAGIRLIRLKGAQPQWPPPEVLRMRLLAAQRTPPPAPEARPSGFEPSAFGPPSDFAPSRSAPDSGVMSLTGLMGLTASSDDPWASVRKR